MTALLIVSQQYGLNPWVKEVFAFPDKQNGIVPVVGVDGWTRIINSNPQYDGVEFSYSDDLVTMPGGKPCPTYIDCAIYRKDRSRPTVVREYLDEVYREASYKTPWQTHTKRFLRHKALIQCARMAFGFAGIYDQDEAERIIEGERVINPSQSESKPTIPAQALIDQINSMELNQLTPDALKSMDIKPYTDVERMEIKHAITQRRKTLKEASVVATQEKEEPKPDQTDWGQLIENAQSQKELDAIFKSIPPELADQFNDWVDFKMDELRDVR